MTLVLSELDKINRQIKLARPDSSARTELLQECDRLIGRLRSITVRLAATDVVPVYAVSYPGERELAKYELRYPRVKFVGRTESLEVLKLQLASFLPADDSRPLTAAERAEQSRRAAGWLARIARGEIRGLDISPAESAVIAALSHEAIGSEAIVVASHIPSTAAQRALSKLILNESANMTLRIEAARHITQSFRLVGVQLPAEEVAGLKSMLDQGGEPVLHQSIAAIIGAMKPVAAETGDRLRGFATPDFEPVPPAPAPPVGDNSEPQP
jgi:hypothetical protein